MITVKGRQRPDASRIPLAKLKAELIELRAEFEPSPESAPRLTADWQHAKILLVHNI